MNGSNYNQQSDIADQEMDQSTDGSGGPKPGEKIYASKDQDDDKKIFVGGLAWETTADSLRKHFSQFGDVLDIDIKTDPVTRKPRGFGFILFATGDGVSNVLSHTDHKVDGKSIDPKPAVALKRPEKKKKLFIGGIGSDLKDEDIRNYFSEFGTVTDTEFPEDKNTKRRLGFAFVTYETSDAAQTVIKKDRFHYINGKKVEVSEAVSREERQQQKMRGGMGMRGGRGRGGYGYGQQYGQGGGYGGYGGYNQGGGYQGYGGGYDYNQGNYNQGGGGGYGGYGDYGAGSYGGGYSGGGGGGGYGGYGGYNSGYEQSGPGKAPVNRRGGGAHHPYSR